MTAVADPTAVAIEPEHELVVAPVEVAPDPAPAPAATRARAAPVRPVRLVTAWLVLTVIGLGLVLANVGPLTEQRDQRDLLADYRTEIESASNQAFGLDGIQVPTEAPSRGTPVGIIDIGAVGLRRVVVEGTAPSETRQGPGHVVGTGGLGQPGNSVVAAHRSLYGGAFGSIGDLDVGDEILVSTTQGQSLYVVAHVGTHPIESGEDQGRDEEAGTTPTTADVVTDETSGDDPTGEDDDAAGNEDTEAPLPDGALTPEQLYGPSADDRLTLVTSASSAPWAADEAQVVVALMEGTPFAPTPQGGRTLEDDGRRGDPPTSAGLMLAAFAYIVAVFGAVWLHRQVAWRSAYLLSAPVLVALTIVLAEQVTSVLPAWA
jgi:sortase A